MGTLQDISDSPTLQTIRSTNENQLSDNVGTKCVSTQRLAPIQNPNELDKKNCNYGLGTIYPDKQNPDSLAPKTEVFSNPKLGTVFPQRQRDLQPVTH